MRQAEAFQRMSLFAVPSFLNGFSRTLDLGGTLDVYNTDESEVVADCKALASDWEQVGRDIYEVMENYKHG